MAGRPSRVVRALERVSLTVRARRTLGIVGESGCGKSDPGAVLVRLYRGCGASTSTDRRAGAQGRVGRAYNAASNGLPGSYSSLNPGLTYGRRWRRRSLPPPAQGGAIARRSPSCSTSCGSADAAGPHPHEFSGGQRQRIGIARGWRSSRNAWSPTSWSRRSTSPFQAQIVNLLLELSRAAASDGAVHRP